MTPHDSAATGRESLVVGRFERLWGQPWTARHQFVVVFRHTVGFGAWRNHSEFDTGEKAYAEAADAARRNPDWEVAVAYETQSWEFIQRIVRD